jgi:hypothetical protein
MIYNITIMSLLDNSLVKEEYLVLLIFLLLATALAVAWVRRVVSFFDSKTHGIALLLICSLKACYGDVWSYLDM